SSELLASRVAAAGDNKPCAFLCESDSGSATDAGQGTCDQDNGSAHSQSFKVCPPIAASGRGKFLVLPKDQDPPRRAGVLDCRNQALVPPSTVRFARRRWQRMRPAPPPLLRCHSG